MGPTRKRIATRLLARAALPTATLALALGVAPMAAGARVHSFEGSCQLSGVVTLAHGIGLTPSPNRFVDSERGRCWGRLDGRRLPARGASVSAIATGEFVGGCGYGAATGALWRITFRPGKVGTAKPQGRARTLRLRDLVALTTGQNETILVRGARGGVAAVTSTFQAGPEVMDSCLKGRLRSVGVTRTLRTVTRVVG